MFSYGMDIEIEGVDELVEQTRRLRDLYKSLKRDFEHDNDESIPHYSAFLRTEVRQTENGPQVHLEIMHRANVTAKLRERKEKIEKLLDGLDELAAAASKVEKEMNNPNNSGTLQ